MSNTALNLENDLTKPKSIIAQCVALSPSDDTYKNHPIIEHFCNPLQPIYVDHNETISDVRYEQSLILPIYNAQLELVQCAYLQYKQQVRFIPDGLARGFAYYGELQTDKPVIITHDLDAFFKIAASISIGFEDDDQSFAVVLVVLPHLCNAKKTGFKDPDDVNKIGLKPFHFEQIQYVIQQLSTAGYTQIYMPTRAEHIKLKPYQNLEQNTVVRLLNQTVQYGDSNESFYIDFKDDSDDSEIQAFIHEAIALLPKHDQWGELLPLAQSEEVKNTPYPIHALPSLAREAVLAIAEYVQAPIAMAAQCVIGAMSHIAQTHVNAPHPFNPQGEPCSLYLLTEGQSGSRKSTSRNMADKAIIKYERKQYKQYCRDLEQWKSGQASLNKKDREAYCAENPPPHDPSTLYSDITLESIAGLYVDGVLNNASIASDEAGQFFGGYTMKGDTRTQAIGGYAKLFDDGFVERMRSKSNLNGSGRAYDVRLTFNLQGQHEVLADALKDPVLRGQGFLPRFILTIPENLAGTRLQDAIYQNKNANHDHRLIAYWTRCEELLDDCPHPHADQELYSGRYVIPMNEQAKEIDLAFYNMFEELQGKGKCYEYLQAFASRASQLARRLATVFAYFQGLQWIDASTLKGACEVIKHSLNEWAMYADVEVKTESDAEKLIKNILSKCIKENTNRILKSLAAKGAPSHLRKAKAFEPCLSELIEFNYVRLVIIDKSTYIELNPVLLE